MTNKELTIIGATGFLSTTITQQLSSSGVSIRVIARNPEKARKTLPSNVEIVKGDVSDLQSLTKALKGTETLYIHLNTETTDMSLPFYTEREGIQNIVEAAKLNNVKHILQIAGLESLHEELFHNGTIETRKIREAGMKFIEDSGIPYTFFYCSFFADSFVRFVDNNAVYLFGELPNPVYFTNSHQLAEYVFQAISNPVAYNQKYSVQGSKGLTFQEAAEQFFEHYNPDVTVNQMPLDAVQQLGLPSEEAMFIERIWDLLRGFK
ncbi:SDR family oxidoreductase [Vibrio paucivorans]|uniref:NAD(P)H-binding protein n=1 Tax=Vibrio paucivorans TaxID=2829489 RepID=A0A9X3CD72_9VIBR|nr:NAD(P)H-binding protein [Vibrio paucivorans]MCW8333649.1 NAD(P)H-binding protein [Vibrio paucivorans]